MTKGNRPTAVPVSVPGAAPAETVQEQLTETSPETTEQPETGPDGVSAPSPLQRIAAQLEVEEDEGKILAAIVRLQQIADLEVVDLDDKKDAKPHPATAAPAAHPVLTEAGWVVPEPATKA